MTSSFGLETVAMTASKPELQKQQWPDLQLHFLSFYPNKEMSAKHALTEEVLNVYNAMYDS